MSEKPPADNKHDMEGQEWKWRDLKVVATTFLLAMLVTLLFLGAASLGFLLLPAFRAIIVAVPIFLVAFLLNALLDRYRLASRLIHVLAVVAICVDFWFAAQGVLAKSGYFLLAYVIGALASYSLYLFGLVCFYKAVRARV